MLLAGGYTLCILLSLSTLCRANESGMKVRMTEDVLNEGVRYSIDSMTAEMSNYNLPDITGTSSIDSEDLSYKFTEIQITNFTCATISSKFVPKTGVQISLQGCNAAIRCNVDLDSSIVKDNGQAAVTLNGISISVSVNVRRNDPGVLSISMLDCQSAIEKADVKVNSGITYFYEIFAKPISDVVRSSVSQQLCSALNTQIIELDTFFRNLEMNYRLNEWIDADLSLVNVEIFETCADFDLKGQFTAHGCTKMNFSSAVMDFPAQTGPRACAGISEASMNSLVEAFYMSGSLNSMLHDVLESKKLTTSELDVQEIAQHYEKPAPVRILLHATDAPKIFLKPKEIIVEFCGQFKMYDITVPENKQLLLEEKMVATLNGELSMADATKFLGLNLTASVTLKSVQVVKNETDRKGTKIVATEASIQKLLIQHVVPTINKKLLKGMPLYSKYLNQPSVNIKQGFVFMEVDFKWNSQNVSSETI